jgi:hypothetical protein
MKEIIIEPILSTGILKATTVVDACTEMYDLVMKNPFCS